MNKRIHHSVALFMLLTLFISPFAVMASDEVPNLLAKFASNSVEGWEYNRPGFSYKPSDIINNKVVIYNDGTIDYTLTSPEIDLTDYPSINVNFSWRCENYNQPEYNLTKGSPQIEIVNSLNEVVKTVQYKLPSKLSLHNISVEIETPLMSNCHVRIAAHNANVDCTGAVKSVEITGIKVISTVGTAENDNIHVNIIGGKAVIHGAANKNIRIIEAVTGRIINQAISLTENYTYDLLQRGVYIIMVDNKAQKVAW